MRDVSGQNFGYLIAFVLPGCVALHGVALLDAGVADWVESATTAGAQPTVGGFLYISLAAVAAGLTVSTIRWLCVDTALHWSGIRRPPWDDSRLQENLGAFEALVTAHYRYYQFYANSVVSLAAVLVGRLWDSHGSRVGLMELGICGLIILYWAGSRDTLNRYYSRVAVLLGTKSRGISNDQRASSRKPTAAARASKSFPANQSGHRRGSSGRKLRAASGSKTARRPAQR